jgi:putative flippase GtrA
MDKLWIIIENVMRLVAYKIFRLKISEENWQKICQFIKFGIVGVSNTLIAYLVYIILIAFHIHYLIASIAGFFVSVINAYYWNNKYVFKHDNEPHVWWQTFLKTFLAYAGTGLILTNILLIMWVDVFHINAALGPVINLFITIPLNYILNKYWAFNKKTSKELASKE